MLFLAAPCDAPSVAILPEMSKTVWVFAEVPLAWKEDKGGGKIFLMQYGIKKRCPPQSSREDVGINQRVLSLELESKRNEKMMQKYIGWKKGVAKLFQMIILGQESD